MPNVMSTTHLKLLLLCIRHQRHKAMANVLAYIVNIIVFSHTHVKHLLSVIFVLIQLISLDISLVMLLYCHGSSKDQSWRSTNRITLENHSWILYFDHAVLIRLNDTCPPHTVKYGDGVSLNVVPDALNARFNALEMQVSPNWNRTCCLLPKCQPGLGVSKKWRGREGKWPVEGTVNH